MTSPDSLPSDGQLQPWRSVADDPPRSEGVVLVFTGEAYSVEYANEVNRQDHQLWMSIPPVLPSYKCSVNGCSNRAWVLNNIAPWYCAEHSHV